MHRLVGILLLLALALMMACSPSGSPSAPPSPASAAARAGTAAQQVGGEQPVSGGGPASDLADTKAYLLARSAELRDHTAALHQAADQYYQLAQAAAFDYIALWQNQQSEVTRVLLDARAQFLAANPSYELMEGIVAGVPDLAHFDIDLDAGVPAAEGPDNVVSFDVPLPDGRVLEKPGNYFYLAELTLWGTNPAWVAAGVRPDLDGNGTVDFGEVLPDANVLKGVAAGFADMATDLRAASEAWHPTLSDAFSALVVMVPTMEEYFQAWKESRYVSGDQATSPQFVAASRLQDIADILGGLQVVYANVQPLIAVADPAQAQHTETALDDLRALVVQLLSREQAGIQFQPEDADLLGAEAQNRATAIAGQITQAAAKLGITLQS